MAASTCDLCCGVGYSTKATTGNKPQQKKEKLKQKKHENNTASQTRCHVGHTGAVPAQTKTVPPLSEDCALKKLTGSGLLECKLRPKLVFFVDWQRILWRFWDEDHFFEDHLFSASKTAWICNFGRKIFCNFSEDLFFWRSPVSGRKIPLNLCFSPCSLDPDWDKFLVPRALLEFTQNKLLVPPKIYFCPPVTLSWRWACCKHLKYSLVQRCIMATTLVQ